MPLKKCLRFLAVSSLLFPVLALAELPSIKVQVFDATPATGTVEVTLFNSAESFMKEPYLQVAGPITEDGSFEGQFIGLVEGEYAVVVAHDANGNGTLDAGFLGFGGERYGYSNNVRPWFGWPDFEDAKFTVDSAETLLEISLD